MTNALATTDERPAADGHELRSYPNGRWQPAAFQSSDFTAPDDPFDDARRIVNAAITILAQGEDMLRALSTDTYTRRVPLAFNACIGGHYRHCLDHFTSLLRGLDADTVDYDHRERDVRIESQPGFALALTVFACSTVVLVMRRREIPVLGSLFLPLHELSCVAKGRQH